jgi:membrane protease subunit HflC
VGTSRDAEFRLRERIDSRLKAEVGRMSLAQFVNKDEPDKIQLEALTDRLTKEIRDVAIEQFGIEVVDVRIKRFNHPEGVKPAIFEMIRTERQGVAEKYRAQGKSEAAMIRSTADKERAQILSKAAAEAEIIRGDGEAEALRIANAAHSQDPQFYQLLKTLETYRTILNEKTTIVLSADSSLLKLLTDGMPDLTNSPKKPARPSGDQRSRTAPSDAPTGNAGGRRGSGPTAPASNGEGSP